MKNFLVIGLGSYGLYLATSLKQFKQDVTIVDNCAEVVEKYKAIFQDISVADCTDREVLKSLGIPHFDVCFVAIGDNFEACSIITALLKEFGAKRIIAKAKKEIQVEILKKIGADEVVYPEHDIAIKTAEKYSIDNVFDYIEIPSTEYDIYEIKVPKPWVGKNLISLQIRAKYDLNLIGVKNAQGTDMSIDPNYAFQEEDHILAICTRPSIEKVKSLK